MRSSITVVLLAAGHGSRFSESGFVTPKPLLQVGSRPLAIRAIESMLRNSSPIKLALGAVVLDAHCTNNRLDEVLTSTFPQCRLVRLSKVLSGPVASASHFIQEAKPTGPIVFVDCDQFFDDERILNKVLDQFEDEAAIVIGVTDSVDPSFGYVATDDLSRVIDVAEKRPISQLALAGFYAFSSSEEFLKLGHLTDSRSLRKEIFFSDLLRTAISCGLRISMVRLKYHYSCGTPQHFEILREHFSRDVF